MIALGDVRINKHFTLNMHFAGFSHIARFHPVVSLMIERDRLRQDRLFESIARESRGGMAFACFIFHG